MSVATPHLDALLAERTDRERAHRSRLLDRAVRRIDAVTWEENKHPRAEDGQFGHGSGGGAGAKPEKSGAPPAPLATGAPPQKPAPPKEPKKIKTAPSPTDVKKVVETYVGHHNPMASHGEGIATTLNKALRSGDTLSPEQEHLAMQMDEAIAAQEPLKENLTLYRGTAADIYSGEEPTELGFGSTTPKANLAAAIGEYAQSEMGGDEAVYVYEIRIPKGARVLDMNKSLPSNHQFRDENEHLLPRGAKFKRGAETREKNVVKVQLEYQLPEE